MDSADLFTTRRLTAQRLRDTHQDDLLRMDQDPRIMNSIGGVRSEEESRAYLQRNLDHWDKHGFGLWMLRLSADGSFVGRAALRNFHFAGNDEFVLGYALIPEYWGMGLATEVATAIVDLAFSRLGFDNLVAGTLSDHWVSRNVMEKVGGRYERDVTYKEAPHVLYRFERTAANSQY